MDITLEKTRDRSELVYIYNKGGCILYGNHSFCGRRLGFTIWWD